MTYPEQPDWFNALSDQQQTDFYEKVRHPNMIDTGAITQAIEVIDSLTEFIVDQGFSEIDSDGMVEAFAALEALKAFKDGPAPCVKGLTLGSDLEAKISEADAVKLVNSVMAPLWEIMMGKAEVVDSIDGDIETKHLQDAIK